MTVKIFCVLAMIAGITSVTLGCGKKAENADYSVDAQEGQVTVKTKQGTATFSTEQKGNAPSDFPKDFQIYKGAGIVGSIDTPDGTMLTLSTKDAPQKVVEFYKKAMPKKGWTEEGVTAFGAQTVLSYSKGERNASVMVAAAEGATQVILTHAKD
ncbi:MAG: hypothetical protein JXN60_08785 [Lentisphaerae bacterium]|nr:hypothetical protein [Lentisphaerota bacterium]